MVAIGSSRTSAENKNFYNQFVVESKLQAARPKAGANTKTIIRIIPEVDEQGNFLPMVKGLTPSGPDLSNFTTHLLATGIGHLEKVSAISTPSDNITLPPVHQPIAGTYIRLKARQNKGQVPPELLALTQQLFAKQQDKPALLENCREYAICQAVVLQLNGQIYEEPRSFQAVFLPPSAAESLAEVLNEAYERGIDVFDPENGYTIEINTLLKDKREGRNVDILRCSLGEQMALDADICKKLWVPWVSGLKLLTMKEQFNLMVRALGRDLMQYLWPNEFEQYFGAPVEKTTAIPEKVLPAPAGKPPVQPAIQAQQKKVLVVKATLPPPVQDDGEEKPAAVAAPAAAKPVVQKVASKLGAKAQSPDQLAAEFDEILNEDKPPM